MWYCRFAFSFCPLLEGALQLSFVLRLERVPHELQEFIRTAPALCTGLVLEEKHAGVARRDLVAIRAPMLRPVEEKHALRRR